MFRRSGRRYGCDAARQLYRASALVLLLLPWAGCTGQDEVVGPKAPTFAAPVLDPLPLHIVYAYDPQIDQPIEFRVARSDQPLAIYHLRLGAATRDSFDRVMPALFARAEPSADPAKPTAAARTCNGAIRIRIVQAHASGAYAAFPAAAAVTYALDLIAPDGAVLAVWEVTGKSQLQEVPARNLELAIRDAA